MREKNRNSYKISLERLSYLTDQIHIIFYPGLNQTTLNYTQKSREKSPWYERNYKINVTIEKGRKEVQKCGLQFTLLNSKISNIMLTIGFSSKHWIDRRAIFWIL